MGFIVLICIVAGSYYLGATNRLGLFTQKVKPAPTITVPIPTFAPSPTPDPTVSWKTYSGTGYSFRYPGTWTKQDIPYGTNLYDPATGSPTGNGGSILYKNNLFVTFISTDQSIKTYIDAIQAKQIPALAGDFQRKSIMLNNAEMEAYHQGGEGTVGWYIPFSDGTQIIDFGPMAIDPSSESAELQIVKTFKFTQQP